LTAQALAQLENRRREEAERRERMDPYWGERLARIKKQNEHLDIIRDRVIAAGKATPQTVDSVICQMDTDEFLYFRGDLFDTSRIHFK